MGQHCSCVHAKKHKEVRKVSNNLPKPRQDTTNLKNSTAPTLCPPHFEIPLNKNGIENLKENPDAFPYNNSVAVSISDGLNLENLQRKLGGEDIEIFHSVKEKKHNYFDAFSSIEFKKKNMRREFNFQEDLNKAKISIVEIYQQNEKGQWIENMNLKHLCALGENEFYKFSPKIIKKETNINDLTEEIAA